RERLRLQLTQQPASVSPRARGARDFQIGREFNERLSADTARRRRLVGVGRHDQRAKFPMTKRDSRRERIPLGAESRRKGGILDITPGNDGAVAAEESGTDTEARIR